MRVHERGAGAHGCPRSLCVLRFTALRRLALFIRMRGAEAGASGGACATAPKLSRRVPRKHERATPRAHA
jgi:hypothetical protein